MKLNTALTLILAALVLLATAANADIEVGYEGGEQGKVVINVEKTLAYQVEFWAKAESGTQDSNYCVGLYYPVTRGVYAGVRYNTFEEQATGLQWGLYYRSRSLLSTPIKETPKTWQAAWKAYNKLDADDKAEVDAVLDELARLLNQYLDEGKDDA